MATINIDNQLSLEYTFRIANKLRKLTFTDECALDMDEVNLKVDKLLDKISDVDDDTLQKKTVDEQTKMLKGFYDDIREAIIPFFNKYMDDSGQDIYDYYKGSTRALAVVFNKIYDYLNKVEITKKSSGNTHANSNISPMVSPMA